MDKENDEKKGALTAICYSDGSSRPNPGYYGSGAHGYLFVRSDKNEKNLDVPTGYQVTDKGYIKKDDIALKTALTVKPVKYFNAIFAYGEEMASNNVAEIEATVKMIYDLVSNESDLAEVIVLSDSEYTIGIYEKLRNPHKFGNFDYRDGKTANAEYYELIEGLLQHLDNSGIKFRIGKVPAHADNLGNNIADRLAVTGTLKGGSIGLKGDFVKYTDGKYWKPNVKKHPLLRVKQLFFSHDTREIDPSFYGIMEYSEEDGLGKKTGDAMYGIVKLKDESKKDIEELISLDEKRTKGLSTLTSLNMNTFYGYLFRGFGDMAKKVFITNKNNGLAIIDEVPIVSVVSPQGLANIAYNLTLSLNDTAKEYNKYKESKVAPEDRIFLDITEHFYKTKEVTKGKKTVKKTELILDNNTSIVNIEVTIEGKVKKVPLVLGKELVDRNTLKQLEKDNPVIMLELKRKNRMNYSFATIVDLNEELGVYCNFYTSTILV